MTATNRQGICPFRIPLAIAAEQTFATLRSTTLVNSSKTTRGNEDKSKTRLGEEKGRQRESIANKSSVSPSLPVSLSSYSVPDVAASFQEAVVDCLIAKAELALRQSGMRILCVGGGVAANGRLRERLEASSRELGYELHIPPLKLCTDNAVMGAIAVERLRAGEIADLSLDVYPGLERPVISPSS